jgi:hypothetical protein
MKFYKSTTLHGKLSKDGKLTKKGKQAVLYEILDGFGIPVEVLKKVKTIEIHHKGVVYSARIEDFKKHGIRKVFTENYVSEVQLVLPRKYWKIKDQEKLL